MSNAHSHRICSLPLQEPIQPNFLMLFTQRIQPLTADHHYELAQEPESTPRQEMQQAHHAYLNQLDAIFTELEDELITIKDEISSRLLNPTIKTQRIGQQVKNIQNMINMCIDVKEKYAKFDEKKGISSATNDEIADLQSYNQRMSRRVSQALFQSQGWNLAGKRNSKG